MKKHSSEILLKTIRHFSSELNKHPVLIGSVTVIFSLGLILISILNRGFILHLGGLGYLGLFLTNFLASATIFIPVPSLIMSFLEGNILNPVLVGVFAGLGSAMGDFLGFLIGFGARSAVNNYLGEGKKLGRFEEWFRKNSFLAVFVLAFIPNPVFDSAGLIAGAFRVSPQNFFLATFFGRTLRNILIALSGRSILG